MRTKHVGDRLVAVLIISPSLALVRALVLLAVLWAPAAAQSVAVDSEPVPATRAALEARAAAAEKAAVSGPEDQRAAKRQEAAALRERLKEGDFQVGDRIALNISGGATPISDTVTVRGGRTLELPNMPPIPLQGVLHSEISDYLTAQLGRYIKHPTVQATPLIRLGVLGEVKSPGFFSVPTDMLVSDAIMRAGGPTGNADINKTTVTRGKQEVWSDKALRQAIVSGMTLDQLNLRPGDALVVAPRSNHDLLRFLQVGGIVLGVALSIYTATRR